MDEKEKNLELSPEEQKAEEEASKEVNIDEIREKLAEELGIDPEDEADLLDKLVDREKAQRERLSGAIKQKISWREKAQASKKTPAKGGGKPNEEIEDFDNKFEKRFQEEMEKRDLESLNIPEDLKSEVKDFAKVKNISIKEAAKLPYIQSRVRELEKEERIKNATPRRSNKGGYSSGVDPSKPLNPGDFDHSTKEGREEWKKAKEDRRKYLANK